VVVLVIVVVCSLLVMLDAVVVCAVVEPVLVLVPVGVVAVLVLVSVVLVQVTLIVVMVAVTIFISGGATTNEASVISLPCDWKTSCRETAKSGVSLITAIAASKICSAESMSATISNPTSHGLEDDRDEATVTVT